MAKLSAPSNKAKIARRVIEVLEYFDDAHPQATVMDIVRRYNRPQSSTSELLSSLVELGLLYKDAFNRSYRLTARAGLLGSTGQPEMVRDGRLLRLVDRLKAQTGLAVAIYGMVGLNLQVIQLQGGGKLDGSKGNILGGMQEPLVKSTAGQLLLSTIPQPRLDGTLRRLNAEARDGENFNPSEMAANLSAMRISGHAVGGAGFGTEAQSLTMLLPDDGSGHPLAVGFIYAASARINIDGLRQCLVDAIRQCIHDEIPEAARLEVVSNAA